MRPVIRPTVLALGLAVAALAAQAAGTVQVSFVHPAKFSDARDARRDSTDNLRELKRYLEQQAARHLRDDQTLAIEVLDVDLAGEIRFSRRVGEGVRVLTGGTDWPRIRLRYRLESAGEAPRTGERDIKDMAYLNRSTGHRSGDPLGHEKHMLDEWLATEFGVAAAQPPVN
jgi:hypothetical protein